MYKCLHKFCEGGWEKGKKFWGFTILHDLVDMLYKQNIPSWIIILDSSSLYVAPNSLQKSNKLKCSKFSISVALLAGLITEISFQIGMFLYFPPSIYLKHL